MNKWKKKNGFAIAIHSFIANEKNQLSLVTGDHILVNEGNEDWLLGRNIFTHKVGIFPYECVSFIEQNNASISSFLSQKSDLLIYEAQMTIRYAFVKLSSISSNLYNNPISSYTSFFSFDNPSTYLKMLNLISDVTSQIELCNNRIGNSAILAHSSLGFIIDNLREALGLSKKQRSLHSTTPTMSTWGRKNDPNYLNTSSIQPPTISIDQPLILHIHLKIKELSKPISCRLYLYDAINKSFLSKPTTLNIDQKQVNKVIFTDDLFYENLEKKYMSNSLYLIIYTFETNDLETKNNTSKPSDTDNDDSISINDGVYTIRKCLSCVLIKLPELNNDSIGTPFIVEAKSFTMKRGKYNILMLPETISTHLSLFQFNTNSNSKDSSLEEKSNFYENDEYEYQNYENDIDENENNHPPFTLRDNRRYTVRKTLLKGTIPPILLDTQKITPTGFSPPSSAHDNLVNHSRTNSITISPSCSIPNLSFNISKPESQSFLVADSLSKLNFKMTRYPLDFNFKITPNLGTLKDIFSEDQLKKGTIISPDYLTSFTGQNESKPIFKILLKKLKLDLYHKYSVIFVRLLDMETNKYVKCFQSFENPSLYNSETWICPVTKSGIEDQFFDFFSINLDSTNLPKSSLLLVIEAFKFNTGFRDAKPQIISYGLLPLFYEPESATPQNEGEIILYSCSKKLQSDEIVSTFIQSGPRERKTVSKKTYPNINHLFEMAPNLKSIGTISYHINTNFISEYINLYKLFNYHDYTNELKSLISNFNFSGFNRWIMYSSKILLNLCSIISSMEGDIGSEAFCALQSMLSTLNMRYNDSLDSLICLFEMMFDQSKNSEYFTDLQNLDDSLLPLIIDKLSMNPEINPENISNLEHEFRDLIKTLPLLLQLVSRSYSLKPSVERKDKVKQIFDLLNQLLKKDVSNPDNEQQEGACILMNQRLLLSHFWKIVDILPSCFDKSFATDVICSFVSNIKDDKESLFSDKMKLLVKVSSKDSFWANNPSKNRLNDMFTKVLNLAVTKSNYMDDVYKILSGLVYSSNSRFVISFLPLLEKFIDTNRYDKQLNYLLLIIAFNFPESFPLRILNKLIFPLKKDIQLPPTFNEKYLSNLFIVDYDEVLKNSERLFIYMYVLFYQKDDIIKKFKYKIFDIFEINFKKDIISSPECRLDSITELFNNHHFVPDSYTIKYKLFLDVFNIALSSKKPELSPFDSFFTQSIYDFNNNFSILTYIFRSFPLNQRLFVPMIEPLLHSMILFPSKDLAELFYLILKADIKLNKDPVIVKKETLNALWDISSSKYDLDGDYYVVKKDKVANTKFLQKDETAFERKNEFKKLYEFNDIAKEHKFVDLASTLFAKDKIPTKNGQKNQSTPKYRKGLLTKEQIRFIIEDFAEKFANLVKGINGVRILQKELEIIQNNDLSSRSELIANEDRFLESMRIIIQASVEIGNEKFTKKMLEIICKFHLICGNNLEAVISLNNYLKLIPCTNEFLIQMKEETLQLFIGQNETQNTKKENVISEDNQSYTVKFKLNPNTSYNSNVFHYNCIGGWNNENMTDTLNCLINGREFHIGVILKIIDLCIESHNESLANQFIDQLQNTCISKFRIIELMPLVCNLRRSVFQKINTRATPPSNYFRVSFYGTKFDKFYQNRTFIYRRDYKLDGLNKFKMELRDMFPEAKIETSLSNIIPSFISKMTENTNQEQPNSNSNSTNFSSQVVSAASIESSDLASQLNYMEDYDGQFIIYQKAIPVPEEELNDPFYFSDNLQNYIEDLSGGSSPSIFRCESFIEQETEHANISSACQYYLKLGNKHFPSIERRIEIDVIHNSTTRKLDSITYSTLLLSRNIHDLTKEKDRVKPFIVKMLQIQTNKDPTKDQKENIHVSKEEEHIAYDSLLKYSAFLTFLMQDNAPYWICYNDYYSTEYAKNNPNDSQRIEALKELFVKVKDNLENSILGLSLIAKQKLLQKDFDMTSQLFRDLNNALSLSANQ